MSILLKLDIDERAKTNKKYTNKFTEQHRKSMESLINLDAYPSYFKGFKYIKFVGFKIIEPPDIHSSATLFSENGFSNSKTFLSLTQGTKATGGASDTEIKKLLKSMLKGWLLNQIPQCVIKMNAPINKYHYITGHTRDETIVKPYNFENVLVALYEPLPGAKVSDVISEVSVLGAVFNPANLPSVKTKEEDIILEAQRAVDSGWIEWDKKDEDDLFDKVYDRIGKMCDAVNFTELKRKQLALEVVESNKDNSSFQLYSMNADKASEWLKKTKYKDTQATKDKKGIKYIVKSFNMVTKGQVDAIKLAKKYPNYEIRVIVHCGTLSPSKAEDEYTRRLSAFWKDWHLQLDAYQQVIFAGKPQSPKNIVLYGGLPQVASIFDIESCVLYVQDGDGEFTQNGVVYGKDNGDSEDEE